MNNKLIFIDELNIIGLIYSIFSKLIGYEVNYLYKSKFIQNSSQTNKLIKFFKIDKNSHLNQNPKKHIKSLDKLFKSCNQILEKNEFKEFINFYTHKLNLDIEGKRKLENVVKFELYKNNIDKNFSAYYIIKDLESKFNKVIYFPSNFNTIVIMKYLNSNIRIRSTLIFLNVITYYLILLPSFFLKLLKIFFQSKLKKKNNFKENKKLFDFAFMPHKGFKYSDFFKKNYFFSKNLVFKKKYNLINIFFNDADSLSLRYIRKYNLDILNIDRKSISIRKIKEVFFEFKPELIFKNLIYKIIFFKIIYLIKIYDHQLKSINQFPKKIYIHYDALCPKFLLFAFHLNNIRTYSSQERSRQHIYLPFLFMDHYFIISDDYKKELDRYGYIVKNYVSLGFSRSRYNQNKEINKNFLKLDQDYKGIVSCFGLYPFPDNKVSGYCESGVSKNSNKKFIEDVLKLSKKYKDFYFVLRFKQTNFFNEEEFKYLINDVKESKNISCDNNYKKVNSYTLAHNSQLIISKWTSIAEEMLSLNKKVILYDNEKYISNYDYFLKNYEYLCTNYDDLINKFDYLISNKNIDIKNYGEQYEYDKYYEKIIDYILEK